MAWWSGVDRGGSWVPEDVGLARRQQNNQKVSVEEDSSGVDYGEHPAVVAGRLIYLATLERISLGSKESFVVDGLEDSWSHIASIELLHHCLFDFGCFLHLQILGGMGEHQAVGGDAYWLGFIQHFADYAGFLFCYFVGELHLPSAILGGKAGVFIVQGGIICHCNESNLILLLIFFGHHLLTPPEWTAAHD